MGGKRSLARVGSRSSFRFELLQVAFYVLCHLKQRLACLLVQDLFRKAAARLDAPTHTI